MSQLKSNARWLAIAQVMKVGMQLLSVTVLARLLAPQYYGVMAMAMAVISFAWFLRDLGTTAAIIQTANLTEELKTSVHRLSSTMGLILMALVCASAPFLALYYREPQLTWVLILIAITFPVTGYTMIHQALAERAGNFRVLTFIEVGSSAVGLFLAIGSAWLGAGVFALVFQNLAIAIVSAICLRRVCDWRPTQPATQSTLRSIAGFSRNLVGFNFINYFSRNADSWIIGRALGAIPLGIYAMATRIMVFPLESVTFVSSRALFPVLSKAQDDKATCRQLYFNTVQSVALLTFPIMAGIWLVREEFVLLVLGARWDQLIPIIAWLAPVGLIRSINSTTGTVFMALGRTDLLFKLGVWGAIVHVAGYLIGVQHGLVGVASVYFGANLLNAAPNLHKAWQLVGAGWGSLAKALWPAALATIFMLVIGWAVKAHAFHGISYVSFATIVLACVLTYAASLRIVFPAQFRMVLAFVKK